MLETLRIQNYALIEELELEFGPGFNVLTGETGAGKSILTGALNLCLGARANANALRSGADKATVEALFRIMTPSRRLAAVLEEHNIALDDDALILSRVLNADGKSRAYANGALVPIGVLAALGEELVDLHGQHEHQSLLKSDRQLDLLDAFGGLEDEAAALGDSVSDLRRMERELHALESDDRDKTRQVAFWEFEVKEIDDAELQPGEEEELSSRLNRITNAEKIFEHARDACMALYEADEGAAVDRVGAALRHVEALADIDESFQPLASQLSEVESAIQALSDELRHFAERMEFDPEELETLNRRKTLIQDLKRKYGASVEEVLAYREETQAKIDAYEQRDARLEALRKTCAQALEGANKQAAALSKARAKAAAKLSKEVSANIQDLGMKGAQFSVEMEPMELSMRGIDRIAFMLAANAGEKSKPLKQVASGGEISRIMLGLKAVFAEADAIPTLIFDEIDAGVGGAIARRVAQKMAALATSHQVLVITHIAQIAVVASRHFTVQKQSNKKRTATTVTPVHDRARVEELARLLDGTVSEVSMQHAQTLLEEFAAL